MSNSRPAKLQLRVANAVFVLLFLVAVGLLQWLSQSYHLQFDWTRTARNSLSAASIAALSALDRPVTVVAFASKQPGLRDSVREIVGRYQRHKPDITLEFVDPDAEPDRVRQAGVRFDGEVQLQYEGATVTLTGLDEENITNTLVRLGRRGERWLVFLDGHGERSPDRRANFDLSNWGKQLRKR
ncbi:MAG: Gldg family protein, partial [Acidiferrobacterales bacterium]